jgi:uncharacterized protein
MNTIGYFEIQSSNPERDKEFYSKLFGWKFTKQEFAPVEYYHIETNGMYGGLLKRPAGIPPQEVGTNAYTCSIQVAHFDESANEILELGGQIALAKFAVPGRCWQGYFMDLDNNVFGIFQVDQNAK